MIYKIKVNWSTDCCEFNWKSGKNARSGTLKTKGCHDDVNSKRVFWPRSQNSAECLYRECSSRYCHRRRRVSWLRVSPCWSQLSTSYVKLSKRKVLVKIKDNWISPSRSLFTGETTHVHPLTYVPRVCLCLL